MALDRVVSRNTHVKCERPASKVSKIMSNVKVVIYVGQMSLGKNIGINRKTFFSNKKYDSYKCWTCAELQNVCGAFTFLTENLYLQFEGMVYQQIVGIPLGSNCAPLIADLFFLFCYERNFMSNLHKSKQYDLIDTSRYLDDIFTIDNPEF